MTSNQELQSMAKYWEEILQRDNAYQAIASEVHNVMYFLGSRRVLELLLKGVKAETMEGLEATYPAYIYNPETNTFKLVKPAGWTEKK